MKLLVTGAGGMLGQALVAAATRVGCEAVAADRSMCDITDPRSVAATIAGTQPRAIVNCAAYTGVDAAETERDQAFAVNADGAGTLARAASDAGVRLLHVSTDYVFDGGATSPWLETDPTSPLGVYGASKLAGEEQVLAAGGDHAIVRTAWLYGAGGGNFVDTMLRLAGERDEVSVVTDQVGCPTWTGHLAPALVELAQRSEDTGVFHAAGEGSCSWNELAVEVFDQAGLSCRVLPLSSERLGRAAPRPSYSVLGTVRRPGVHLPHWAEGVRGHLAMREEAVR